MPLDQGQMIFIENKVKELGSVEGADSFYRPKEFGRLAGKLDKVAKYARRYARKFYQVKFQRGRKGET